MPTAPRKLDITTKGLTSCVCGYDLTGIARDHSAKCPECGLLLSSLRVRRSRYTHNWLMYTIAMVPSMLMIGGFLVYLILGGELVKPEYANMLFVVAFIWLALGSFPACIMVVEGIEPKIPLGRRVALDLLGFVVCAALNVGVFLAFMMLVRTIA